MEIIIHYDGDYPNLCGGYLVVSVDGHTYDFGRYALSTSGSVWFDDKGYDQVSEGEWRINHWPDAVPEDIRDAIEEAINEQVEHGCCGGCI